MTARSAADGSDGWLSAVVAGAVAAALATAWMGAELASLAHGHRLRAGLGPTFHALLRLPANAGDPAAAWGPPWGASLPGPVLYWVCTGAAAAFAVVALALGLRLFGGWRVGTQRRRRLGVDTNARLATPQDLRPILVKRPMPGRVILGRVGGKLVANELWDPGQRGRRDPRAGDRSAIAVIGPSRCGKSANIISAILENRGPAILSSVKGDLLEATIARRRQLGGQIKVFDPTAITGASRADWSPVARCHSVTGAMNLARALASANPSSLPHDGYFSAMAEQLLWPLLFTARVSGATMGDVVRWILAEDESVADITARLDPLCSGANPALYRHATMAMRLLRSLWEKEPRTRAGYYTTALTMVAPWEDPIVADCATRTDITLDWLVSGPNTLYICSPMHEQLRLATVFGGILDDLLQQAYEWRHTHGARLPDTLMVLDEAANTPASWLPQVASTCSGIGIQLVTVWQSKAQIDHAYRDLADSVLTNHGTKLFFSGISDPSTLDYVSRLVGDEEVLQRASSNDLTSGRRSVNDSATRLRLVPADVLRQAPPGQGLLVHGTLRPAHITGRFYYSEKSLRRLAGEASVLAAAASLGPPPAPAALNPPPPPPPDPSGLPVVVLGTPAEPAP